ncbi:ABC transporter ATP-binding protein [Modestobacter sp. Leaf380]|uniref:ABC transporter ATP-binding protein n=1 Tax=Modestobacter sp. Leaf380 TaxID=1736356 RepID=UPI00070133C5|nr:ABC transporter ATP-binding protein [Modestobacter sp. Leaf380]KQS66207.1 hypothetical protein ASG41_12825 [Modestobacter sp. Leaf380]
MTASSPSTHALDVADVTVRFGAVAALDGVSLTVPTGSFTALLGPSGCGKTTLLRVVAGFLTPTSGRVTIAGRPVAGHGHRVAPDRRGVGVVPQDGSLFPHLDVRANVAFGLPRARRRDGRADELLDLLGLGGMGARMPHELSGGQQQRVALARALAPRPALVLLDEPFSALDAGLRVAVRDDVRAAVAADGATALLVTHDQEEALSTADRVAVLRAGRLVQAGAPRELYRSPVDAELAGFLGTAVLLPGTVTGHSAVETPLGRHELDVPGRPGSEVEVLVRPEDLRAGDGDGTGTAGVVEGVRFSGPDTVLTVRVAGLGLVAVRERSIHRRPGDRVRLQVHGPVRAWPRRT